MNYIDLINQFWRMRRTARFSHSEADLYFYLLNEANGLRWQNPFPHPTKLLCASIGMSEKTLTEARNKLKQKGLIDFKEGSRNATTPVYTLLLLSDLPVKNTDFGKQKPQQNRKQPAKQNVQHIRNKLNESKLNFQELGRSDEVGFEERAVKTSLPEPTTEPNTVNPKLVKSVPLEDLLQDAALMMGNVPPDFIEAWWLKYDSEGWMTGGQFPKPIFKPAAKIRQHWLDDKLMPNARKYGEERSTSSPVWNGKANNGSNPDEELSIEFDGEVYAFKRRDCNYNGEIVNQDHQFFNQIQMAQMLGGSISAKGAVN
jgi:hypothetical protein